MCLPAAALFVNSEYGGSELTRVDGSYIFEALAGGCTSTTAYLTIHNMCCWMLDTFANEEQKARLLPDLASMEVRAAAAAARTAEPPPC